MIKIEPTIHEIRQAWTNAIEAEDVPKARSEYKLKLRLLRDKKTTWSSEAEKALRVELDEYLGGRNDTAI